jgi:hypothetical protein
MRTRSPISNWLIAILTLLLAAGGIFYTAFTGRLPDLACRQNQTNLYLPLDSQSPLTQTIQPTADHFSALTIYPQADPGSPYSITIRIYDTHDPATPLAMIRRPLRAVRSGKLHIPFKPLPAGHSYQLAITTDAPPEDLFLAASADNRYAQGDLFTADEDPLPNDLTFNAFYRPSISAWLKLFTQSLPIIFRWLFCTCLVLLVGLAFYFVIRPDSANAKSLSNLILQSIGLGLALIICIGYTQSALNIPITGLGLLVWSAILLAALVLRMLLDRKKRVLSFSLPAPAMDDAALFLLFLFVCFSRAIQTIGLEPIPLWVDGFNHFTKLSFLAQDGILPLHINYPFGYHLLTYFSYLLTGFDLPAAAFHTGFWLSALAIPAAWPLARRIFSQRWLALLVVVLYGFFAPFPAYLATWSRFPFLLGLTLLPLALNAALEWLQRPRINLHREISFALPAAILAAGLVLSHYGTIIHYAAFLPVTLLIWHVWPEGESQASLRRQILRLIGLALPALAILLVKIISLMQRGLWENALTANQIGNQAIDLRYSLNLTTLHGGWLLWGLAIAGLLTSLIWKNRRKTAFLAVGWLLMLSLLNLLQVILLGTAISSWMNYIIALSMPLSWLAASALAAAGSAMKSFLHKDKFPAFLPATFLSCMILAGFTGISGIINPVTILFTSQDRQAMEWISENTPQNAVFYIDSFQWGASITPSNGGGWIPALTNRGAVHPYINEQRASLQDFLIQRNVNYVYTHNTQPLADIPLFANAILVFQNETIVIYQISFPKY